MPTWCSAISIPRISWAAARKLDAAAAEPALDRLGGGAEGGPHRRGRRRASRGQHQHGGGHPPRVGPPRRRSATLRAAVVRRCGGAACDGRRAPARSDARRGAARRGGAVGLGHAGDRSALRGVAHAYRRHRAAGRRRHQAPVRRDGAGGPGAAARIVRRAGARAALGGNALRRADLRDHRAAGWHRLGRRRSAAADRRAVPRPA